MTNQMRDGSWYGEDYFHDPYGLKSNYRHYTSETRPFEADAELITSRFVSARRKTPLEALDVGCAMGFLVEALRKRGVEAFGLDISEYAIGEASPEVKPYLRVGDMRELPYADRSFDLVIAIDILEHATEDAIRGILEEFKRVLKRPHGKVFAIINTGEYPYQAAGGDKSHNLLKPLDWWEALFEEMGIKGEVYRT